MSKSEKINKDINDIQKNEIIDNELTFINYVSNTDENTFGFYNKIINSLEKNPMFLKHLPTNSKYYYNYIYILVFERCKNKIIFMNRKIEKHMKDTMINSIFSATSFWRCSSFSRFVAFHFVPSS